MIGLRRGPGCLGTTGGDRGVWGPRENRLVAAAVTVGIRQREAHAVGLSSAAGRGPFTKTLRGHWTTGVATS